MADAKTAEILKSDEWQKPSIMKSPGRSMRSSITKH